MYVYYVVEAASMASSAVAAHLTTGASFEMINGHSMSTGFVIPSVVIGIMHFDDRAVNFTYKIRGNTFT